MKGDQNSVEGDKRVRELRWGGGGVGEAKGKDNAVPERYEYKVGRDGGGLITRTIDRADDGFG